MIPEGRLSSTPVPAPFVDSFETSSPLVAIEYGGIALNDAKEGIRVKPWTLRYDKSSGDLLLSADGVATVALFNRPDITEVSFAFDRNMQPFVAFVQSGQAKLWFYDDQVPGFIFWETELGSAKNPRCTHDDKRITQSGVSDIVLAYVRNGQLYYRQQRDRYAVEYFLAAGVQKLHRIGMNRKMRLQFAYEGVGIPYSPFLADVVSDLLHRSGIGDERVDVEQLYADRVDGYRIASEGGADVMIAPLQRGWFFDPYEADGKLRFQMRQQSHPQGELPPDALVEQDGPALSIERAQEAELLRKVNLTTIDSSIDYVPNTQTAERRSGTVLAIGEQSSELPITCEPDFAATVARRQLTVAWGEMQTYKFSLPIQFSYLSPTDVMTIRDQRGRLHRMRVMQIEEDGGELIIEATEHAPWAYDAQATGVQAAPPISTAPGLVGDTDVIILNLPVLRDQDDELGVYVCALGTGSGWRGGEVQLSTDGGLSVGQFLQVTFPANAGRTLSPLAAEVSAEYASSQTLAVSLRWEAESISRDQLLRYGNLAALQHPGGTWELIQFETATETAPGEFLLSGLLRGRYATGTGAVPADARFVLIDDNLIFVQLQQWMIGQNVSYRGVSYGQDSDEAAWATHTLVTPASQTEWPVHSVRALRDGTGAVTVSWVGRGRLGVETSPRHSKYFTGYRVIYSDGFTADTADSTHTRVGAPAGVTVQVAAINSITGPGPASEAIPT